MLIVVSLCPDKKTTEPLKGLISSCVTAFRLRPEGFKLQNTVAWPSVPSRCNAMETYETYESAVTCKIRCKNPLVNYYLDMSLKTFSLFFYSYLCIRYEIKDGTSTKIYAESYPFNHLWVIYLVEMTDY